MERKDFVAAILLTAIAVGSFITVWTLRNVAENRVRESKEQPSRVENTQRPEHSVKSTQPQTRATTSTPEHTQRAKALPFYTKPKTTFNQAVADAGIPQYRAVSGKNNAASSAPVQNSASALPADKAATTTQANAQPAAQDVAAQQQIQAYLAQIEQNYGTETAQKIHDLIESARRGELTPQQFTEQSQSVLQNRRAELLVQQRQAVHQQAKDYLHKIQSSEPFQQLTPEQQAVWLQQAKGHLKTMEQEINSLSQRTDLTRQQLQQAMEQVQADTNTKLQSIRL